MADVIAGGDPLPAVDLHCPLASLPGALSLRIDMVPARPYINVPAGENARQGAVLRCRVVGPVERGDLVVGLLWGYAIRRVLDSRLRDGA